MIHSIVLSRASRRAFPGREKLDGKNHIKMNREAAYQDRSNESNAVRAVYDSYGSGHDGPEVIAPSQAQEIIEK